MQDARDIQEIRKIYRKKAFLMFGIIAVSVIIYVILLMTQLQSEAIKKQDTNNTRFFSSTLSHLNSNTTEIETLISDFHENNDIMLEDLVQAFSGSNYRRLRALPDEEQTDLLKRASNSMDNCVWVLIVDSESTILASSFPEDIGANVVDDHLNELDEESFKNLCNEVTDYVIIKNPYASNGVEGDSLYLYCKAIPGTYEATGSKYILLGFTSKIIDTMIDSMGDLSSWVNDASIGNGGTAYVIDGTKDIILHGMTNEGSIEGSKASEIGFTPEILTNRYKGMAEISGAKCYVSTRSFSSELYGENNYIVSVVPVRNLYAIDLSVVFWNICLFTIFLFLIVFYTSYIRGEIMKKRDPLINQKIPGLKGVFFSNKLASKIIPIVFAAVFLLWGAVFYFQTLIKLSDCFSDTVSIESEIMTNMEESTELQKEFKDYYNMQYTSRADLASVIVSLNSDQYLNTQQGEQALTQYRPTDSKDNDNKNKDDSDNIVYVLNNSKALQDLRYENDVENIYLISDRGYTIATSSDFWNLSLPTDSDKDFYGFWDVLYGKSDHYIEDLKSYGDDEEDDDSRYIARYVGAPMYYYTYTDETGNTVYANFIDYMHRDDEQNAGKDIVRHRGLILLEVWALENDFILESARPEYVLEHTHISNEGFLTGYIYDEDKNDYKVFYSQNDNLLKKYAKDLEISENAFNGYYNGFHRYNGELYLESFREGKDYYISTSMPVDALYTDSFNSAINCAFYAFVIMMIIALMMVCVTERGEEMLYRDKSDPFALFGIELQFENWKGKNSEQKFEEIVKGSFILLGMIFLLSMIHEVYRLGNYSAILYIITGDWDRGVHIFSVSAAILVIIVAAILIHIFEKIAYLMAEAFGNRVVTMMHMMIALIKTLGMVFVILYCLYMMGIDGKSLLASAGVMSVVVGLGAQSLVGDLLAGIFIILEGSLRVGDYVMIDGVRGKVMQIGLRITRYEDDNQNIRVICNNQLKTFANMSIKYSVVYYNIPVPYNEDYIRIKNILNEEFLGLYERNRFLKGIPLCMGIEEFGESSVDLRLRFVCEETDRYNVQRFMHDEIMRIFQENNITIPFNQLDIHVEQEFVKKETEENRN